MAKVSKRTWKTAIGETRQAWRIDFTEADGTRQRKQFRTKREADDFRVDLETQLRSGLFRREAHKTTVIDACILFLKYGEERNKRGERFVTAHLQAVTGHVWNYISPDPARRKAAGKSAARPFDNGIGGLKLSQLTQKKVIEFRDRLRDAGVGVILTRSILTTLHAILEYAKTQDLVATNAAHGIKVIGRRDEGAKKVVIPPTELVKLLLHLADRDFRMRLIVAVTTAVRASEQNALRWQHFDLKAGNVEIETRVDRWHQEDATKTAAGNRTIPLAKPVVALLLEWKSRTAFDDDDDLVFPNTKGTYVGHDNMVKRKFNPLIVRLRKLHTANPEQYPKVGRTHWHVLRHYGISAWIHQGLSPKTIQTFAGHANLATTMDRYGHLFRSEDHNTAVESIAQELLDS